MTSARELKRNRGAQTARNLVANVVMFGIQTVVALLFTPYLIAHLGVGVFGLIPLANTIAAYVSVLTIAIQGSVGRYVTVSLRRGEREAADEIFNTALWATIALSVVLIPGFAVLSWFAPSIFAVPDGMAQAVRVFFALTLIAYLISVVRSVFMTAGVASNRLDIQNLAPLTEVLSRPAMTVILFGLGAVSLVVVGWTALAAVVLSLGVSVVVWKRLAPTLTVRASQFSQERLSAMWRTSGWMMVSQLGTMLFLGIDMVIANIALGVEAAGRYGAVLIWATFLRGAATAASGVVTPVALRAFAEGDEEELTALMKSAVRLLGLAIGIPVFVVAGLSRPLLQGWLGADFLVVAPLLAVLVGHLVVNLAVLPLFSLTLAKDRVRVPGLVTLGTGLVNAGLAWSLARLDATGLGIALAGALVLTAKNALFTPLYAAHVQDAPWSTYLVELLPGLVLSVMFGVAAWLMAQRGLVSPTLLAVVIAGAGLAGLYAALAWLFMRPRERRFVRMLVTVPGLKGIA